LRLLQQQRLQQLSNSETISSGFAAIDKVQVPDGIWTFLIYLITYFDILDCSYKNSSLFGMGGGKKYSDEKLIVDLCREGVDTDAFELLFHRYYPMVLNFTRSLVKDPVVAEDIAQNSFMKLWLNRFSLQSGLSVKNYLCVLSRNDAINYLRSANSRNVCLDPQSESPLQNSSVEDWLTFAETNIRLNNIIETLPPQRKTIFKMSRFDHMSNTEIAVKLNLSVRTVEKHLELALKDLRSSMS
jgi:RNA polymerase sigma-70 factor (ECF subfamily)